MCRRWLVFLSLFLFSVSSLAFGEATDKTLSPYFFVENADSQVDAFSLKSTSVEARVVGVIASVKVRQIYKNEGQRPLNARYVFPGSTRAAVHGLVMRVGDKQVRAQIKEKQQAQREFEQAKQSGKTASLLTQERPNVFTMNLSNVMPQDVVEVVLEYSELLVPEKGVYEWVYPTVVGPRYENGSSDSSQTWIESPYLKADAPGSDTRPRALPTLAIKVTVLAGMPIADFQSPSHLISAHWKKPSEAVAEFSPDEKAGNRDFVLRYRLTQSQVDSGILLSDAAAGKNEKFFLLQVQPPARVKSSDIPARDYVFVVDVSGSMHGFPLETAKGLLEKLAQGLRPKDTFNILFFSGGSKTLSETSLPATRENVDLGLAMLSTIGGGGGGTELLPALRHALSLPGNDDKARSIVVITDGYVTVEREAFGLIRENLGKANLFSFGIGSSVNRFLIEGMARAGQGQPFFVLSPSESEAVVSRFKEYIDRPVLTEVKVTFDGFSAYDVEPLAIADVMAERPVVVLGKWKGERKGKIALTGMTASGPWTKTFEVKDFEASPENAPLRYLWARTRVARISDDAQGALSELEKEEVTLLGLNYELLTQFTSFLAVLEQVRNPMGDAVEVTQPLPLPQGVSELAVGGDSMEEGDEPGLVWLVMALGLAMGAMAIRKRWSLA